MNRISRWQWVWLAAAVIWGAIVYVQTDWPRPASAIEQSAPDGRNRDVRRLVIDRVGYWLLTSVAAYFVCHGFVWSRRGVSRDINHLR